MDPRDRGFGGDSSDGAPVAVIGMIPVTMKVSVLEATYRAEALAGAGAGGPQPTANEIAAKIQKVEQWHPVFARKYPAGENADDGVFSTFHNVTEVERQDPYAHFKFVGIARNFGGTLDVRVRYNATQGSDKFAVGIQGYMPCIMTPAVRITNLLVNGVHRVDDATAFPPGCILGWTLDCHAAHAAGAAGDYEYPILFDATDQQGQPTFEAMRMGVVTQQTTKYAGKFLPLNVCSTP